MTTPIWGPSGPQQRDESAAAPEPDPYAAPSQGPTEAPYGGTSPYGASGAPAANPYGTGGYATGGYPAAAHGGPVPYPGTTGYAAASYPAAWPTQAAPAAWATTRTEPLAIASLVTSGAGLLTGALSGPVGVGLGIAALRRIRREGTRGRAMAITGIVLGAVLTVVLIGALVLLVVVGRTQSTADSASSFGSSVSGADPGAADGSGGSGTTLPLYALTAQFAAGDCLADAPYEYDMSDAVVVDCATSHGAEVLSAVELSAPVTEDLLAGDPAYSEALGTCTAQADALLAGSGALDDLGFVDFYYPHPSQWDSGGRSGYCVLVTDELTSGSAVAGSLVTGPSLGV